MRSSGQGHAGIDVVRGAARPRRRAHPRASGSRLFLLALALGLQASNAGGDEPIDDAFDRWQPSLNLGIGVHNQVLDIEGTSTLGGSGKGSGAILTSIFGFNGGIQTPALSGDFGKPRVYLRAGYQFPVSNEFTVLDEDSVVTAPEFQSDPTLCGASQTPNTQSCEHNVRTEIDLKALFSAGLGVEFSIPPEATPLELQEFKLSLGVEYLGERLKYTGMISRVDRGQTPTGGVGQILDRVRLPEANNDEFVHAMGPRMAASANVAQIGPVSVHFFVDTTFYWYLDEDDATFGVNTGTDTSSFRVEKDEFITQATGGMRLVWR